MAESEEEDIEKLPVKNANSRQECLTHSFADFTHSYFTSYSFKFGKVEISDSGYMVHSRLR